MKDAQPNVRAHPVPDASPRVRPHLGRILLVEDEPDVAELIRYNLANAGYEVTKVSTGTDALRLAREASPDLILLDLMIPQLNGWEVCRRLRAEAATRAIPVIIVTARVEEGDKVLGFEMGADDYITKPFAVRELLARIQAVMRRSRPEAHEKKHRLSAGDLEIDRRRFEVSIKGQHVELTLKEFELLEALVAEPGRVFSREELLDRVWGRDGFVEPRTVDVHLARLRGKFSAAHVPPPRIETVRGVGYRFRESDGPGSSSKGRGNARSMDGHR
jgi:two-component system alkaline phosphatase synthesis response regulator PhoP